MPDLIFRNVRFEEVKLVGELFNTNWRKNHVFYRNPEVLLWQYFKNPYIRQFTSDLTLYGIFDHGRIIGVHGFIPFLFNVFGEKSYACHFCNWYVSPEIRRGPWGIKLTTDVLKQYPFQACFGFGFTDMSRPLLEMIGWNIERSLERYVLIISKEKCTSLFAGKQPFMDFIESQSPKESLKVADALNPDDDIKEISTIEPLEWDEFFWNDLAPGYIGTAKEKKYLIWRYEQIPEFNYRYLYINKHDSAQGLLVFRTEQVRDKEARIFRVMDLLGGHDVRERLLSEIRRIAILENAAFIDFFCTSQSYHNDLLNHGFFFSDGKGTYPLPFLFQPLDENSLSFNFGWQVLDKKIDKDTFRKNLYYTKADGDLDRPN